jgi:hypothetical protein
MIIQRTPQRRPLLEDLIGENGRKLLLRLGSRDGCVQFSSQHGWIRIRGSRCCEAAGVTSLGR